MVSLIHASMMLTSSSSRNHGGPKSHPTVLKDQWVTEHGPQSYPLQHKVQMTPHHTLWLTSNLVLA